MDGLLTGVGLDARSPIMMLRNRILSYKGEAHKLPAFERLALTIKAWNAFYSGKILSILKWNSRGSGKNAEAFPRIIATPEQIEEE